MTGEAGLQWAEHGQAPGEQVVSMAKKTAGLVVKFGGGSAVGTVVACNGASSGSSSMSSSMAPIGLKALGFGLLGAALAMVVVETMQMVHLFPNMRTMWRRCTTVRAQEEPASRVKQGGRASDGPVKQSKKKVKITDGPPESLLIDNDERLRPTPRSSTQLPPVHSSSYTCVESFMSNLTTASTAATAGLALQASADMLMTALSKKPLCQNSTRDKDVQTSKELQQPPSPPTTDALVSKSIQCTPATSPLTTLPAEKAKLPVLIPVSQQTSVHVVPAMESCKDRGNTAKLDKSREAWVPVARYAKSEPSGIDLAATTSLFAMVDDIASNEAESFSSIPFSNKASLSACNAACSAIFTSKMDESTFPKQGSYGPSVPSDWPIDTNDLCNTDTNQRMSTSVAITTDYLKASSFDHLATDVTSLSFKSSSSLRTSRQSTLPAAVQGNIRPSVTSAGNSKQSPIGIPTTTAATKDELMSGDESYSDMGFSPGDKDMDTIPVSTIGSPVSNGPAFDDESTCVHEDDNEVGDNHENDRTMANVSPIKVAFRRSELPQWQPSAELLSPKTQAANIQRRYRCTKCRAVLGTVSENTKRMTGTAIPCCMAKCTGYAEEIKTKPPIQSAVSAPAAMTCGSSQRTSRILATEMRSCSRNDMFTSFDEIAVAARDSRMLPRQQPNDNSIPPATEKAPLVSLGTKAKSAAAILDKTPRSPQNRAHIAASAPATHVTPALDQFYFDSVGTQKQRRTADQPVANYEEEWQKFQKTPKVTFTLGSDKPYFELKKDDKGYFYSYEGDATSETELPPAGPRGFATIVMSPQEVCMAAKLCVSLRNVCPDCGIMVVTIPGLEASKMAALKNSADILILIGTSNPPFSKVSTMSEVMPLLWKITSFQKIVVIPPTYELSRETPTKIYGLLNVDRVAMFWELQTGLCSLTDNFSEPKLCALVLIPSRMIYTKLKRELKGLAAEDFRNDFESLKYMLVRTMPKVRIAGIDPSQFGLQSSTIGAAHEHPITWSHHVMIN